MLLAVSRDLFAKISAKWHLRHLKISWCCYISWCYMRSIHWDSLPVLLLPLPAALDLLLLLGRNCLKREEHFWGKGIGQRSNWVKLSGKWQSDWMKWKMKIWSNKMKIWFNEHLKTKITSFSSSLSTNAGCYSNAGLSFELRRWFENRNASHLLLNGVREYSHLKFPNTSYFHQEEEG